MRNLGRLAGLWHRGIFRPDLISGSSIFISGLNPVGAFSDAAQVGNHAALGLSSNDGAVTLPRWGLSKADVEDGGTPGQGTGTSPTDFASADSGDPLAPALLWASGVVNGVRVFTSAPIRAVPPTISTATTFSAQGTAFGATKTLDPAVFSGLPATFTRTMRMFSPDETLATGDGTAVLNHANTAAEDNELIDGETVVTCSGGVVTSPADNSFQVADFTAPVISGVPTIAGTLEIGETLTATPASVSGNPTPTRALQWQANGVDIAGATSLQHVLVAAQEGATITVEQDEVNAIGSDFAENAASAIVRYPAPTTTGSVAAQSHEENTGDQTVATAGAFSFGGTRLYTLQTAITGVSINSSTGVVTFDTNSMAVQAGTTVTVRLADANAVSRFSEVSFSLAITAASGAARTLTNVSVGAFASGVLPVTVTSPDTVNGETLKWVLVPNGQSAPSATQINNEQNSAGGSPSDSGSFTWPGPANLTIATGLDGQFDLYVIVSNGSLSNVESDLNFEVDSTNPTFSTVTATQTGATTATWGATSNEAQGTIFAAVRLSTDLALSASEIENGTGNAVATSTDATPTADANNQGSFSGLSASTTYQVDAFQRDEFGNESPVASSSSFTTAAGAATLSHTHLGSSGELVGGGTLDLDLTGVAQGETLRILVSKSRGAPTSTITASDLEGQAAVIEESTKDELDDSFAAYYLTVTVNATAAGNASATFTIAGQGSYVASVHRVEGSIGTPIVIPHNFDTTPTSMSADANTEDDGVVIACAVAEEDTSGSGAWTGVTSITDLVDSSNERHMHAAVEVVTGETPRTITRTTGATGNQGAILAVAFPPA